MYLFDFEYLYLFLRYSPPNFEVVRNGAKFCIFLALEIFWGDPSNFWTQFLKFSLLQTTVQNFAAIGRRSLEIPWRTNKTSAVKLKSAL